MTKIGKFDFKVLQSYAKACIAYAQLAKKQELSAEDEKLKQDTLEFMQRVERLYKLDE